MMTEILDQEVGPAPVGNMGLTIKGRARDAHSPSIVPDQPFVIVSVNKEEDLYTIALFPVGEDTAACALSEFLTAAHDHSVEYGGPEYQMAAVSLGVMNGKIVFNKRQIQILAGKEHWGPLLSETRQREEEQGIDPPAEDASDIIGRSVTVLPIVEANGMYRYWSGLLSESDIEGFVTVTTDDGDTLDVPFALARAFLIPLTVGISVANLPPDLKSVLKKMANSSCAAFTREEICAFELTHLAGSCGLPPRFVLPVTDKFHPKSPQFEYAAATLLAELAASLEGKVLGSSYSTDATRLGEQLAARAKAGFVDLRGAPSPVQVAPVGLAPRSTTNATANKFRLRFTDENEYSAFITDAVEITALPKLHAFTSKSDARKEGALDRFLRSLAVSDERIQTIPMGINAEDAIQQLLELQLEAEEGSAERAAGSKGSSAQEIALAAAAAVSQVTAASSSGYLGHIKGASTSERIANTAAREAMRRISADATLKARLADMMRCVTTEDFVGLERLKNSETNDDILLLISGDIEDEYAELQGAGNDHELGLVSSIRGGLVERLCTSLFPKKKMSDISARVIKAVNAVRSGRLSKLRLANLLDIDESGKVTPDGFFKGIQASKDSMALFGRAINMTRDIVILVAPQQIHEAMLFFNEAYDIIDAYRSRGCPWSLLAPYFYKIMVSVERPALAFGRGAGASGVLFDLSVSVFNRDTERRIKLDEQFTDYRDEQKATAKAPKQPSTPSTPKTTPAGAPASTPSSKIPSEDWNKLMQKMIAEKPEHDGKKPCSAHFIKGACSSGASCKFHHVGKAGSIKL